ncbi:hypothetical protein U9M48_029342, partial [Paspalum notatum var. saurae]
ILKRLEFPGAQGSSARLLAVCRPMRRRAAAARSEAAPRRERTRASLLQSGFSWARRRSPPGVPGLAAVAATRAVLGPARLCVPWRGGRRWLATEPPAPSSCTVGHSGVVLRRCGHSRRYGAEGKASGWAAPWPLKSASRAQRSLSLSRLPQSTDAAASWLMSSASAQGHSRLAVRLVCRLRPRFSRCHLCPGQRSAGGPEPMCTAERGTAGTTCTTKHAAMTGNGFEMAHWGGGRHADASDRSYSEAGRQQRGAAGGTAKQRPGGGSGWLNSAKGQRSSLNSTQCLASAILCWTPSCPMISTGSSLLLGIARLPDTESPSSSELPSKAIAPVPEHVQKTGTTMDKAKDDDPSNFFLPLIHGLLPPISTSAAVLSPGGASPTTAAF